MSVTSELETFIVDEITLGRGIREIEPDEDLLSRGVTQLVEFLEERFGIVVADEDLTPANFQTLNRIDAFVACKQPC